MCKFCNVDNHGGSMETIESQTINIRIGSRVVEEQRLSLKIGNIDDERHWRLYTNYVSLNLDDELAIVDVPISYCPFCGRKL